MSINKKPSVISDSKFPLFIRDGEEYDALRAFIKSYFQSLEAPGAAVRTLINAREDSDVDSTTAEFLERFYSIMCPELPTHIAADKRLLLKHSRELYELKGTPSSFKLLFRILFNETISLKYPNENLLKASDGVWNLPVAIHLKFNNVTDTQIYGLVGSEIVCNNSTGTVRNEVLQIKRIPGTSVWECMINKQKGIRFGTGDTVTINGITALVLNCTQSIQVIKPGAKFKVGQPLRLDTATASGTIIKVTAVDANGGIKKAKIIRFGTGYDTDMYVTVIPPIFKEVTQVINDASLPMMDTMDGFKESGFIAKSGKLGPQYDYFAEDYMEEDEHYTQAIITYFGDTTISQDESGVGPDDYATIRVTVGPVITYPGFWSSNKGCLSDPLICLQDNQFYQNFSYVIQSSVPRSDYEDVVKRTIHPAGMRMFSDLLITNEFDIGTDLRDDMGVPYRLYVNDGFGLPDNAFVSVLKPVADSFTLPDSSKFSMNKELTETITLTDDIGKDITIPVADSTTLADTTTIDLTKKVSDTFNPGDDSDGGYTSPDWTYGVYAEIQSTYKTITKTENDSITVVDGNPSVN